MDVTIETQKNSDTTARLSLYAKRIKELRERQNMSQEEFANKCGHTSDNARSWASKVENGRIKLSLDDAVVVANALGVLPIDLIPDNSCEDSPKIDFTQLEVKLINDYRKLSENGRDKARERINELLKLEGKE